MSCRGFGVDYSVDGDTRVGCDSYYSVDQGFGSEWMSLNATDIIHHLGSLTQLEKPDIVITGGEPLLYWTNTEFQTMLEYFIDHGHFVTIETNGSIDILIDRAYQQQVAFSIGLKLQNSLEKQSKRIHTNAIQTLLNNSTLSYLKLVTSGSDEELKEIVDIQDKLDIQNHHIYLMPLGATQTELEQTTLAVVEQSIKHHYRYSDRLHIRIWNDKREV